MSQGSWYAVAMERMAPWRRYRQRGITSGGGWFELGSDHRWALLLNEIT